MRIFLGKSLIIINADKNVTAHATADFKSTDMSEYNIAAPTVKEYRGLYYEAQRIFYVMKAKRGTVEECYAARAEYANKYQRYKEALIAAHEKKE